MIGKQNRRQHSNLIELDIEATNLVCFKACCDWCSEVANCKGWTRQVSGGWCYLKSTTEFSGSHPDWDMGSADSDGGETIVFLVGRNISCF